ncbi:CBS domain-containing protein [Fusobacterium necrophorum]|uniref:CBS domain-containing protein n=1 Tax=Fusobacterium necrophorum TaxID=859 RepID=UPI0030EF6F26
MLVAVDRNRRLIGSITAENALKAIKEELLLDVVENNVISISKDMLVTDIFPLIYNSQTPLAVIENEKVVGVLVKGCIIEALANNNSKNIPLQMTEGGESHV